MPHQQTLYTIPTTGVGKPDYSREVSLGQIRPGLSLKYLQSLRVFGVTGSPIASPLPFITPPIAIGGVANMVDFATGLPGPFNLQQGYTMTMIQIGCAFDQDFKIRAYLDGLFAGYLILSGSGLASIFSNVAPFSSATFDPTGATAHTFDLTVENNGLAVMRGSTTIYVLAEEVGSDPLPTSKTLRCKFCGHTWVMPNETTRINCPNCGELNIFINDRAIKRI
jgi:predicted RNA-binding Zn-ribbon protein involved in translation (DUF1610 family)